MIAPSALFRQRVHGTKADQIVDAPAVMLVLVGPGPRVPQIVVPVAIALLIGSLIFEH